MEHLSLEPRSNLFHQQPEQDVSQSLLSLTLDSECSYHLPQKESHPIGQSHIYDRLISTVRSNIFKTDKGKNHTSLGAGRNSVGFRPLLLSFHD